MTDTRARSWRLAGRLSPQDASFVYGESRSGPLHIGSINFFDGRIDYDELLAHIGARIHLLPRYRQRLVLAPLNLAHPALRDDPDFDLRHHIKFHSLPHGADEKSLLDAAMREFGVRLPRNRPLWQIHLYDGLEAGSVLLWKLHHCLVDGVSGMELLSIALDLRPDAPPPEPEAEPFKPGPLPDLADEFADALRTATRDAIADTIRLFDLADAPDQLSRLGLVMVDAAASLASITPAVAAPWNAGLVTAERSLTHLKIPFADVRAIRTAFGATVNDVVVAILSEAAARYLAHHGVPTAGSILRIACPVNVRRADDRDALGNRISMMFPELPAAPLDPVARMRAVIDATARAKRDGHAAAIEMIARLCGMLPPAALGLASTVVTNTLDAASALARIMPSLDHSIAVPAPGINFLATNVPGAQVPLYLAGRRMTNLIGCVPLAANLGYNVAMVSYNQTLVFGLMAEPRLIPDLELMREFAARAFDDLFAAAHAPHAAGERERSRELKRKLRPSAAA